MLEAVAKFGENALGKAPLFVVGSGLSMGAGISGMPQLAASLGQTINALPADQLTWNTVLGQINSGVGLEQALLRADSSLSLELRDEIIRQTWRCIGRDEIAPLFRIANGNDLTGFQALLKKFAFSTNRVLHVITTNYDHLLECTAAMAEWPVWDGFDRGHIGRPITSDRWDAQMTRVSHRKRPEAIQHLRLYKPHGSLSWFRNRSGGLVKIQGLNEAHVDALIAEGFTPAIVAPGSAKYFETHMDPYFGVLSHMNSAIQLASAMVFVGFGFNDLHIQGRFEQKLQDPHVPKIILAKSLTEPLRLMIEAGKVVNYVAVEETTGGASAVRSDSLEGGAVDHNIWSLKGFISNAWGLEVAS